MCTACEWAPHFSQLGRSSRRTVMRAAVLVAGATPLSACSAPTGSPQGTGPCGRPCRRLFRNGLVHTVSGPEPWAQAVAVTGNTITYVGEDAGIEPFVGSGTRIVDLGGRLLMPGFVEGHTHPFLGSFRPRASTCRWRRSPTRWV